MVPALNFIQSFCFLSVADDLHASRPCPITQVPWNQYPAENWAAPGQAPPSFLRFQAHNVRRIALCFQQFTNCLFSKSFRMKSMRTAPGGGGGKKQTPSENRRNVLLGAEPCFPGLPRASRGASTGSSRRPHDHTVTRAARTPSLGHQT